MNMFNKIYLELNLLHKKFLSKKEYFSFSGVDIILEKIFKKAFEACCENGIRYVAMNVFIYSGPFVCNSTKTHKIIPACFDPGPSKAPKNSKNCYLDIKT